MDRDIDIVRYVDRLPPDLISRFVHWCILEWAKPSILYFWDEHGYQDMKNDMEPHESYELLLPIAETYGKQFTDWLNNWVDDGNIVPTEEFLRFKYGSIRLNSFATAIRYAIDLKHSTEQLEFHIRNIAFNCGISAYIDRPNINQVYEQKLFNLCAQFKVNLDELA